MKKAFLLILAGFPLLLLGAETAAAQSVVQAQTKIENVKIYQRGAFMQLKATAQLKGGSETIVIPDLWYVSSGTLQVKLSEATQESGIKFVMESKPTPEVAALSLYRTNQRILDSLQSKGRVLIVDSLVLNRRMEFLQANMEQKTASASQLQATGDYLNQQYKEVYVQQLKLFEAMAEYRRQIRRYVNYQKELEKTYSQSTQVQLQVNSPKPRKIEFDISYYTHAAEWEPVYSFRFDLDKPTAEMDFDASIHQWTTFHWTNVPVQLSYNRPGAAIPTKIYIPSRTIHYYPPVSPIQQPKLGYTKSDEGVKVTALGIKKQDRSLGYVQASQVDISYDLKTAVTLRYSTSDGQIYQTLPVKQFTDMPVYYTFDAVPATGNGVVLQANIPNWREYYLTNGEMNVYYDGQILSKTKLFTSSEVSDTLSIPLWVDPNVVVTRNRINDYTEKISGSKKERTESYEIVIKNNREYSLELYVKDSYPISANSEIDVKLLESSGAEINPSTGLLNWKVNLPPGGQQRLTFSYSLKYPKEGEIDETTSY